MSRPVSYTSAVTVNIASFSGITGSVSTGTSYPPTNGINSSANTSSYAAFSGTSSAASGYAYYKFDTLSIPSNATINSVSCVAVGRVSNTSRCYGAFQLMAGSTAKGNATNFNTTSVSACTLSTGSWTLSELQNIALRITVRRAGNQSGSARFYGATLTVNYSINGTEYEVSFSNSTTVTTDPSSTHYILQNESETIKIYASDTNNIEVKDNGSTVVLTPSYEIVSALTGVVTSYDSSNSNSSTSSSNQTNACAGTTNTTFATLAGGQRTQYYYYYSFSVSNLPSNAEIINVSVDLKCCKYSTYSWEARLCNGTTTLESMAITATTSSSSSPAESDAKITTIQTNQFTRSNIGNAKLEFYPTTGSSNIKLFFYGADITVTYSVTESTVQYYTYTISNISADHVISISDAAAGPTMYIKQGNSWTQLNKVYKKVNGSWAEQSDLSNLFSDGTIYING